MYTEAERLAEISGALLSKPRCPNRQVSRASDDSNSEPTTASTYFKRSVWYPFLDSISCELDEKFSEDTFTALSIFRLLQDPEVKAEDCRKSYVMYGKYFNCTEEELFYEFRLYQSYRTLLSENDSILERIQSTPTRFENVKKCLQITATIPITSCTAGRAFSAMKILKTRLRSTMTDARLNGLALMYIHKDADLVPEELVTAFAKLCKRKLDFLL